MHQLKIKHIAVLEERVLLDTHFKIKNYQFVMASNNQLTFSLLRM